MVEDDIYNRKLIQTYLRHGSNPNDQDSWAWEEVDQMTRLDPDQAWNLVLKMINAASSKHLLSWVAAGPLEDLINKHAQLLWPRVKTECENNQRLVYALSKVIIGLQHQNIQVEAKVLLNRQLKASLKSLQDLP